MKSLTVEKTFGTGQKKITSKKPKKKKSKKKKKKS